MRKRAIDFEQRNSARTYLMIEASTNQLLAYFTLTFKEIALQEHVSGAQRRALDGFSKHAEYIKAFLIGQIGKNDQLADNPLSIDLILDEGVYPIILDAQSLIGGRAVLLECEDTPSLIRLYERAGFKALQKQELVQLFLIL